VHDIEGDGGESSRRYSSDKYMSKGCRCCGKEAKAAERTTS